MADKAYIVANGKQERKALEQFETKGYVWFDEGEKPTEWVPSHIEHLVEFPYALLDDGELSWCYIHQLGDAEIVYDGRKENKVKISKEAYDALVEWKKRRHPINNAVNSFDLMELSRKDEEWWQGIDTTKTTNTNNWLITLIRWVSGEDVLEVEEPKKWIVRSKNTDNTGDYGYVSINQYNITFNAYHISSATKFDTKEEAESWANAHQEVIGMEA